MSVKLVMKYADAVDELFKAESKLSLLTNSDYDWTGAHSVAVWKISTVPMNDYSRNLAPSDYSDFADNDIVLSRFGKIVDLDAQVEEMLLTKDRSFIFNVDKLDEEETSGQVKAASALARQIREVVIPEVDTYVYAKMAAGAGNTAVASALTADNIYSAIVSGTEIMDDAEVPDTERVIVVTPATYRIMKQSKDIALDCDIAQEMRLKGVISMVDGMPIVKVPASRLPENFGFMIAHPSATTAPVKLEDYGTHPDTCLSSGTIITGRIAYDAFVLDNKKAGIYYHPVA